MSKEKLYRDIEDIVYDWVQDGSPIDNLAESIYDYVIEAYGPPF